MIDLETLDVQPTAAILTIGAVKFNPKITTSVDDLREKTLLLRLDLDAQFELGFTYSDDTINWWADQPKEVKDAAFYGDRISLQDGLDKLHSFVWNSDRFWSQGSFDYVILEHLYRKMQRTPAWNYWQVRDSRTLFDFIDGNLNRKTGHHDAAEDAVQQAVAVQRALKKIHWTGDKL
jgi:hypothetical protein